MCALSFPPNPNSEYPHFRVSVLSDLWASEPGACALIASTTNALLRAGIADPGAVRATRLVVGELSLRSVSSCAESVRRLRRNSVGGAAGTPRLPLSVTLALEYQAICSSGSAS
jgi:hypothetical protein